MQRSQRPTSFGGSLSLCLSAKCRKGSLNRFGDSCVKFNLCSIKLHIRDRRMAAEEVHKSVGWALSRNQRAGAVV